MKRQAAKNHSAKNHSGGFRRKFVIGFAFLLSASACTNSQNLRSQIASVRSSVGLNGGTNGNSEPRAIQTAAGFYSKKSDFEGKTFSLVRGIEEADSNNVAGVIPGMSDDFGFVSARITENEIQFLEVFNPFNKAATQAILASYEIKEHFDIRQAANGQIIEEAGLPWSQLPYFRVDWSKPTNQKSKLWTWDDASAAPANIENIVQLTDPTVQSGHISWLTEFSIASTQGWWGTSAGSRVIMRTHLMPVLATDYQALNYRAADFKRFGMFFTQQRLEDPEHGLTDSGLENNSFANLHNVCEPGRKDAAGKALTCSTNKIVWHLTKNFPDKYREPSRQAVREWNEAFKSALGRVDDVVTLDETLDVDVIDPRYNTIALYASKAPGGLLGVAQETANPMTGELIASRATVYDDGIKSQLGYVDDLVTLILNDDSIRKAFLATSADSKQRVSEFAKSKSLLHQRMASNRFALGKAEKAGAPLTPRTDHLIQAKDDIANLVMKLQEPVARSVARKEALMREAPEFFATNEQSRMGGVLASFDDAFGLLGAKHPTAARLSRDLSGIEHLHDVGAGLREERARMINQASTGVHGSELVEEATVRYIKKVLAAHPEAADFQQQVAAIKAEVEQKTFYTTLLHEMGHTFGLRHNFQASADAKHYHREFFRLSKIIVAEKDLPDDAKTVTTADLQPYMFSSIMDYGGDFYSQVGGLGSYDNAAIKYAYNRSIDRENDPIVKEGFQFCTDHQVGESILCRRFDKGRNVSEITMNLIETYQTNYVLSHNRRNRANFERRARAYPMSALSRYFIPIRQVMDESVFALIHSKKVPAKTDECERDYWRVSVDAGEIANVCDPVTAEQAGVDPTNLESFEVALLDQNGLRKDPTTYLAYGLADLLYANLIAKNFYADVLGSTEPGTYIAVPVKSQGFQLEKLAEGDVDEALVAFATAHGIDLSPELLLKMKSLVGQVKLGRYGKTLDSKWDESDSQPRQVSIGSFWDKYIAMISLGIKDIGVEKYSRNSMSGNAYSFPTTTSFAQAVVRSMILQKNRLASIPFTLNEGGQTVLATVEPALNPDLRVIATIEALTDFVSDGDRSIVSKLRVCSQDERGCLAPFDNQKVTEFTTASGQDVYRAVQTLNGDSISFELVKSASDIDRERKDWVLKTQRASDIAVESIMKLEELKTARAKLEATLTALNISELNPLIPQLLADDGKTQSIWFVVNVLGRQGEKVPVFKTMELTRRITASFGATMQVLKNSFVALDPQSQCPVPETASLKPRLEPKPSPVGSLLANSGDLGFFAINNGAETTPPAVTPSAEGSKLDCAVVNARRSELIAGAAEFQQFAGALTSILQASQQAKIAPLRAKNLTDELERSEANVTLIRRIMKATGLQ